jgi:hypothetical protein
MSWPAAGQEHHHGMPPETTRESSGTSWQPDSTPMWGWHLMSGPWMLMVHGGADLVYDDQGGRRGDRDLLAPSMVMLMAQRAAGPGTLLLRGMVSLDPAAVGRRGYPLLLQTGETADGRTPLVDRQHPHDLFMELAARYSLPVGGSGSVSAYVGFPGEPALGPPTYMHRLSGMALPEAPITHHWLDSTHVTFGVATLGVSWKRVKVEASTFTGREPDQDRWGFDAPKLDSYSGRLSLNPTPDLALQLSAAHIKSPEQLEPERDVDRFTASLSYNRRRGAGDWQTTGSWGRNRTAGRSRDGFLLESTWWSGKKHTLAARGEAVEKDELFAAGPLAQAAFHVKKLSAAYVYEVVGRSHWSLGAGGLASLYGLPLELRSAYGSNPVSFMAFLRGNIR